MTTNGTNASWVALADSHVAQLPGVFGILDSRPPNLEGLAAGGTSMAMRGGTGATVLGTGSARTIDTTKARNRVARVGFTSTAPAGSLCGLFHTAGVCSASMGDGSRYSGFTAQFVWQIADATIVAAARMLVCLASSGAPTNAEPATYTNFIGVGQKGTDTTQFYLMYNGAAATAVSVALGTAVGTPGSTTDAFSFVIKASYLQDSSFQWFLTNLVTGVSVSGAITGVLGTSLPPVGTLLMPKLWRSNNATATAVALEVHRYAVWANI